MSKLPTDIEADIRARARGFFFPSRRALSLRYPRLAPFAVAAHRLYGSLKRVGLRNRREGPALPQLIYKHGSLLRRTLGSSDPRLQEQKIKNLSIAIRYINGTVIEHQKTFSFWKSLGAITKRKGYVNGMLLSQGRVQEGIGGGLCQLSNLLYWIFLHGPFQIVERHHHSYDPFPDNGRTLPFGSGATIMDRILDLRVKNMNDQRLQLRLWMTDTHLYGGLYGVRPLQEKYHVCERHPYFVRINGVVFRYNQIFREVVHNGSVVRTEHIATNFAPVMYDVTAPVIDLDSPKCSATPRRSAL
jgi:vancomycin resistance protein VanW